jgi:hypothetical protein
MALTFDAAADHQLESLRRDRFVDDFDRSKKDLRRLVKQIDHLAKAVAELPPFSIGKLNKIIAKQNWQQNVFRTNAGDAGCAVRAVPS